MLAGLYGTDLNDKDYAGRSSGGQFGLNLLLTKPGVFAIAYTRGIRVLWDL